jgi:hypothetical protein
MQPCSKQGHQLHQWEQQQLATTAFHCSQHQYQLLVPETARPAMVLQLKALARESLHKYY